MSYHPKATAGAPARASRPLSSPPLQKRDMSTTHFTTTSSILLLITHRFALPMLPGLAARVTAITAHGNPPLGDLTAALDLLPR
jgi:phospholipase C